MKRIVDFVQGQWMNPQTLPPKSYTCGYCGRYVSSSLGYILKQYSSVCGGTYICTNCNTPSIMYPDETMFPGVQFGNRVGSVPDSLSKLYEEARTCSGHECYTAAVLICRKMLMNIAVEQGARPGLNFFEYVSYLSDNNYVPPTGKQWVDHIREKGNEANHEIALMGAEDANDLITFIEMLLKIIYEFPSRIPVPPVPV